MCMSRRREILCGFSARVDSRLPARLVPRSGAVVFVFSFITRVRFPLIDEVVGVEQGHAVREKLRALTIEDVEDALDFMAQKDASRGSFGL